MATFFEVLADPTNKVYIDGVELDCSGKTVNIDRAYFLGWKEVSTSSKPSIHDSGVIYNGEIHFIGSKKSDPTVGMHCKFDGTNWTSDVTTLPYNPAYCKAIVFNDEIHIFGGHPNSLTHSKNYASQKYHYKLNKDTNQWEKVSTLPYYFFGGSAVIYKGQIHLLGGGRTNTTKKKHVYLKVSNNKYSWKSSTSLNQLLRGLYKAFVYTNSEGKETLYFCGEKALTPTLSNNYYSKLYYLGVEKKKNKWLLAWDFAKFTGSETEPNCGYADMFMSFGGETYVYGSNNGNLYKDSIKGFLFNDNTGLIASPYGFADNIWDARIGKYSHMFFYDGEVYIFNENGTTLKSNAMAYTIKVE